MFWRRNLYVLWTALFFGMLATTLILPFLPLYVEELGVTDQDAVAMWSALLFPATSSRRPFSHPSGARWPTVTAAN